MTSGQFIPQDYRFPENDTMGERIRRKWVLQDKQYAKFYYKKQRARVGEFRKAD